MTNCKFFSFLRILVFFKKTTMPEPFFITVAAAVGTCQAAASIYKDVNGRQVSVVNKYPCFQSFVSVLTLVLLFCLYFSLKVPSSRWSKAGEWRRQDGLQDTSAKPSDVDFFLPKYLWLHTFLGLNTIRKIQRDPFPSIQRRSSFWQPQLLLHQTRWNLSVWQ